MDCPNKSISCSSMGHIDSTFAQFVEAGFLSSVVDDANSRFIQEVMLFGSIMDASFEGESLSDISVAVILSKTTEETKDCAASLLRTFNPAKLSNDLLIVLIRSRLDMDVILEYLLTSGAVKLTKFLALMLMHWTGDMKLLIQHPSCYSHTIQTRLLALLDLIEEGGIGEVCATVELFEFAVCDGRSDAILMMIHLKFRQEVKLTLEHYNMLVAAGRSPLMIDSVFHRINLDGKMRVSMTCDQVQSLVWTYFNSQHAKSYSYGSRPVSLRSLFKSKADRLLAMRWLQAWILVGPRASPTGTAVPYHEAPCPAGCMAFLILAKPSYAVEHGINHKWRSSRRN